MIDTVVLDQNIEQLDEIELETPQTNFASGSD
jgi:hypothetical protein